MTYIDAAAELPPTYTAQYAIVQQYTELQTNRIPVHFIRNSDGMYALLLVNSRHNNAQSITDDTHSQEVTNAEPVSSTTFNVNDCVVKCQGILGLKINEIAKLSGVSRATLDLHRKGANVKDMDGYHKLYDFVSKVEERYGNAIKNSTRNVLIERKTLAQHFMRNSDDLDSTLPLIHEVSEKAKAMNVVDSDIDASKLNIRLSRIGKTM